MADPTPASGLALHREGAVLRLAGRLDRDAASAAWPALWPQLEGVQVLDLSAVTHLDSAGLALLAEVADRLSARGTPLRIESPPRDLAELCAAYRLDPGLGYAVPTP